MDQEKLRKRARMLKAQQEISFKEMAACLGVSRSTMYNWLSSQYALSEEKAYKLEEIIISLED